MPRPLPPPPPDDWERAQIGLAYLNKAQKHLLDGEVLETAKHLDHAKRALGPLADQPKALVWMELGINLSEELARLTHSLRARTNRKATLPRKPEPDPFPFENFPQKVQSHLHFMRYLVEKGKVSDG